MHPPLRAAAPTLLGVGVGPGDPELLTVKAVRAFGEADAILVPSTEASGEAAGRAEQLILAACPDAARRLVRVPFAMREQGTGPRRRAAWAASAQAAVDAFAAGARTVAFATVGDPSVYSTFSYLAAEVAARVPELAVEVIPGITAMQALAAASRTPLVEGRETLCLVPLTAGPERFAEALDAGATVVAYKGGRHLAGLVAEVRARGRGGVLGEEVGTDRERLTPLGEVTEDACGYFSTVLVPAPRGGIGAAL